ncbi:MAG: CxxxxCH/CxxCH domain-containing protein [Deltaproteobacteria bacterium]|nr:CxxxxCH/CxxCH domain-containing protein [Deltaproteobacteria bacterium]
MRAFGVGVLLVSCCVAVASSCLIPRDLGEPENDCVACHGSAERDSTALLQAAPPYDLSGQTETTAPGVGAHQLHLTPSSSHAAVPCSECHLVPTSTDMLGHTDTAAPAEYFPGDLARQGDALPTYDPATRTCAGTYCHMDADERSGSVGPPVWTAPRGASCGSCHSLPPPPPHDASVDCGDCHQPVVTDGMFIAAVDLHIDGVVQVAGPGVCNTCHGNADNAAPPVATTGHSETSASGVGAHQTHLLGGHGAAEEGTAATARAVLCGECHLVPERVDDAGHNDTALPAELTFGGVASSHGASPAYDGASCSNSYCHGAAFVDGNESGGNLTTPAWTAVDGSQIGCDSCHGMPPPGPGGTHSTATTCHLCHTHVNDDYSFNEPELHVNGVVD